jgi:cytochrome bd-type quinol oxidase subunit 1
MATLRDEINDLQSENRTVEETVDDHVKRQRAKDQSRIAWVIVWAFVVSIALIFFLVIFVLWNDCSGTDLNCLQWKEPATFLLSIVSSVLLPVVTLVLGYYFGKEKAQ